MMIKGYENLYSIDTKGKFYSLVTNKSRRKKILKTYYNFEVFNLTEKKVLDEFLTFDKAIGFS